ncbi:hypothetical protein D3C86_1404030 [compost metagenome]
MALFGPDLVSAVQVCSGLDLSSIYGNGRSTYSLAQAIGYFSIYGLCFYAYITALAVFAFDFYVNGFVQQFILQIRLLLKDIV